MSKYTYINILKSKAKILKKTSNLKLSQAQEIISKESGFSDFHELITVADRNPEDKRLMSAALGVSDLVELIHLNEDNIYYELSSKLDDLMSGNIAETNATGFGIDDYDCSDQTYNTENGVVTLDLSVSYAGEQDDDRVFHGSAFYVDIVINLQNIDGIWEFEPFDDIEVIKIVSDVEKYHEIDTYEEIQEEHQNKELAEKLGISYDELSQLTWEFDTDESNDGLIYRHIMVIDDDAPQEILDKIDGLDDRKYVYFDPSEFHSEEPDFI